ncbi:heparinase II/III-family protein [Roseococcus sp. SDR]|uniref:heparinase II/III family protein n=1 Tax=Roseococcus sp. SDR TaxID=2835532 RepID=UPI001BD013C4|nr:heparinase II/III-family protein [Roseococcus sp. SDR]MBS7792380.1 heparinase II/III-family protein [Roseococcus sp. SDR]MBV1847694.1 heparinase II/III-family protein [Roseococcus sp. SDR]
MNAARLLGAGPVAWALLGRGPWARGWVRWRLRDGVPPEGADLMAGPDVRPLWEANRWSEWPRLALAGEGDAIPGRVAAWLAEHPPYHGPVWACGQEAALRALHLALASALAGMAAPPAAMRTLARRIGANPAYARAQDNNHPVSEAAGLLVCGMALGENSLARRGARRLDALIARLVAADGGFAQPSPAYHRMLLDVMAVTQWLRERGGGPAAAPLTLARMAAATRWLHRLACPATGLLPRLGHQDGSHVADLSGAGPDDARASLERAARIFCGASAGWPGDPGCAALGLAVPRPVLAGEPDWQAGGLLGRRFGPFRAVLRVGPLRFRPAHADLLHLDLWREGENLLRDGGTGAYNPEDPAWLGYFQGAAAHNTIAFDGEDQMPRLGPFLFHHWPETGALPDGGWWRDHRGRRHARVLHAAHGGLCVEDRVSGPFQAAVLRWRLMPAEWAMTEDGVTGAGLRLHLTADGPVTLRLVQGLESLAYGAATPLPVLEACMPPATSRLTTLIRNL